MLGNFLRKRVIAENRYDIAMQYLKKHEYKKAANEYFEIGMGYFGFEFLVRRFYYIIKQKLQSKILMREAVKNT